MQMKQVSLAVIMTILFFLQTIGQTANTRTGAPLLDLSGLKSIGTVEERYQSYNIEMCEIVGGNFWIPYALVDSSRIEKEGIAALKANIPAIDLYNKKLRTLATALGSAYVRVSGTWANTVYFQDNDLPKQMPTPDGYENVLTREQWKGVIDFCKATNSKLVTSFAITSGMRDQDGNWTPRQIEPMINYTKKIGGEIYAASLFNEPTHAVYGGAPRGYNAAYYAKDFAAFKQFVDSAMPQMKILGPGSTGEGGILPISKSLAIDKIFTAKPKPEFDIFSYHFYGGVSQRCMGGLTPEKALSPEWLSMTELGLKAYQEARDTYLPETPIWLTETAEAACGGDPWAATYVDCFRYVEQLGRLAQKGVQVVMHNTLCASEYALLEQDTYEPRPNYWLALVWKRLMGNTVYQLEQPIDGVDIFVHSLAGAKDGLAVLIVNPHDSVQSISIPSKADRYVLTSDSENLQSKVIKLNGKILKLDDNDSLPDISGEKTSVGNVEIPPSSIIFLTFKNL